jgi:hypothetical protein
MGEDSEGQLRTVVSNVAVALQLSIDVEVMEIRVVPLIVGVSIGFEQFALERMPFVTTPRVALSPTSVGN